MDGFAGEFTRQHIETFAKKLPKTMRAHG